MERELCGKWMLRAKARCAKGKGHKNQCRTKEQMQRHNEYRRNNTDYAAMYQRRLERNPDFNKDKYQRYGWIYELGRVRFDRL